MFYYNAFGLNIKSDIELAKLTGVEKLQPDVLFFNTQSNATIDKPSIIRKNFQANNHSFAYTITDTNFYFNAITQELNFSFNNKQQFEQYLYGPVLALISAYLKKIPLHAAGVVVNNKVILIAGNSGSGKSTFLYHLLKTYQARFFSDDLVVLEKKDTMVYAYSSIPEIKLWLDAIDRFKATKIKPVHPDIQKYFVDVKNYFLNKEQLPKIIFIIETSLNSQLKIEKVTGVNKYLYLSKNVYRKNIIESLFKQNLFEQLTSLANQTQVYIISRPVVISTEKWNAFVDSCLKQIS
ncbi:MAG: hypothetical protein ACUVQP_00665 [Bacteroidales bacterium]